MRQRSGYLLNQIAQDFEFRVSLAQVEASPQAITQRILDWTNGDPFLTYRLYELILQGPLQRPDRSSLDGEGRWVDAYVQTQLIDRCTDPELIKHLRDICRCLIEDPRSNQILRLYQAVLAGRSLRANLMNYVQRRLVQSGIVAVSEDDLQSPRLLLSNRFYGAIFNQAWLARAFKTVEARLRQEALSAIEAAFDPTLSDPKPRVSDLTRPAVSRALHPELQACWVLPEGDRPRGDALSSHGSRKAQDLSQFSRGETGSLDSSRRLAIALVACTMGALSILLLTYVARRIDSGPDENWRFPSVLEIRTFFGDSGR